MSCSLKAVAQDILLSREAYRNFVCSARSVATKNSYTKTLQSKFVRWGLGSCICHSDLQLISGIVPTREGGDRQNIRWDTHFPYHISQTNFHKVYPYISKSYGIAEMSEEDYNILHERRRKWFEDKQQRLSKKNKGKKARWVQTQKRG